MADRSIKVTLRADVNDFNQGMQQASRAVDEVAKKSTETARTSTGVMSRMAQSAREQRAEWSQVGGALTAVGAGWTALNVAVAKTGIEYNTLQQTSRAALRSILGDAEAVNKQMAELDEFAKTSPFSKATFITAQQQMLAFGIEADKVVGYLSAINDATAAAGGNNETLAELSFIMAQISAAGKITAQDLMQFGQRGVNAAELIGSQMGKTGAQIREDITDGALDANDALDALAAGMSERFEGASANVKETMGGALDRVSAAWRDLSADIMASAVSPDGGGWLVDLTNSLADFMRGIGNLPDEVKQVGGIISGLGGAATLAAGGFLLAAPRIVDTMDAIKVLSERAPTATAALGKLGRAGGVAAAAFLGFAVVTTAVEQLVDQTRGIENLAGAVEQLATAGGTLEDLNLALPQRELAGLKISADDLAEAYENLQFYTGGMMNDGILNNAFQGLMDMVGLTTAETEIRETFRAIDEALRSLDGDGAAEAFTKIREGMEGVSDVELMHLFPEYASQIRTELQGLTDELGPMASSMSNVAAVMRGELPEGLVWTAEGLMTAKAAAEQNVPVLGDLAEAEDEAAKAAEEHAKLLDKTTDALSGAVDAAQQYSNSLLALSGSEMGVESSIASLTDTIKENTKEYGKNAGGLDLTTEAGRSNQQALDNLVVSNQQYIKTLHDQGLSNDEIAAKTKRAKDEWIAGAIAMGKSTEEAERLAEAHFAIPSEVATWLGTQGMAAAMEDVSRWEAALDGLSNEEKTAFFAELDGKSESYVEGRLDYLARDRTTNVHVTQTGGVVITPTIRGGGRGIEIPQANGGVLDFYVNGGLRESHIAQIAPAGAWRIWAEPETGGEAYIPLAESKRARSLDIWQETGRRLGVQGFADGGMYQPTYGAQSFGSSSITYGPQHNTYHLSFPGMTEVADVVAVIKDAPRQARLQGGRR